MPNGKSWRMNESSATGIKKLKRKDRPSLRKRKNKKSSISGKA